jgi:hypothetical protein
VVKKFIKQKENRMMRIVKNQMSAVGSFVYFFRSVKAIFMASCFLIVVGAPAFAANSPFTDDGVAIPEITKKRYECQKAYDYRMDLVKKYFDKLMDEKKAEINALSSKIETMKARNLTVEINQLRKAEYERTEAMEEFDKLKIDRINRSNKIKADFKECLENAEKKP